MPRIETLYVVNHSHTDIGFTDHQDVCFRHHSEYIEQALNLCEATANYPEEARFPGYARSRAPPNAISGARPALNAPGS